jgi:hypothetical protein
VTESLGTVKGFRPEIIEAGTYPATVVDIKGMNGVRGPYAMWLFQPDGFSEDAQPAGFSSISAGRTSKGMEWARRILGKSDATDMLYGKDIKDKRPVVDWGAEELSGKPCRIVVEKNYDEDEEAYRNLVTNVLPVADSDGADVDDLEGIEALDVVDR